MAQAIEEFHHSVDSYLEFCAQRGSDRRNPIRVSSWSASTRPCIVSWRAGPRSRESASMGSWRSCSQAVRLRQGRGNKSGETRRKTVLNALRQPGEQSKQIAKRSNSGSRMPLGAAASRDCSLEGSRQRPHAILDDKHIACSHQSSSRSWPEPEACVPRATLQVPRKRRLALSLWRKAHHKLMDVH